MNTNIIKIIYFLCAILTVVIAKPWSIFIAIVAATINTMYLLYLFVSHKYRRNKLKNSTCWPCTNIHGPKVVREYDLDDEYSSHAVSKTSLSENTWGRRSRGISLSGINTDREDRIVHGIISDVGTSSCPSDCYGSADSSISIDGTYD